MQLANGYSRLTSISFIFAFIDGLLIISGVLLGGILRYWGGEGIRYQLDYFGWKLMVIISVMQTVFYYFDLYEFRNFGRRIKTAVLMVESLGVSSVILAVIYYFSPFLAIGRGFFTISLLAIFLLNFAWRLIYPWIIKKSMVKEKILIVGTGDMAKRIQNEILQNGQDGYEIVGFIGEGGEEIGKDNGSEDYRELQPDLFHLSRRSN